MFAKIYAHALCIARESKREETRGGGWAREALDEWVGRGAAKYMYDI